MQKPLPPLAQATMTASAVVTVLAVVSVCLRFYTRWMIKAGFKVDDWWILVGTLSMLCTGGILLYGKSIVSRSPRISHFDIDLA